MEQIATLADLARIFSADATQSVGALETVTRMIHATGPLNSHLAFTPERGRYERTAPLASNTPVFGRYLTLTYDGHWPALTLTEHNHRDDMAEHIVDWVLLRQEVFAIENGKFLPYTIVYDDVNGPRRHYDPNTPTPGLVWIDERDG